MESLECPVSGGKNWYVFKKVITVDPEEGYKKGLDSNGRLEITKFIQLQSIQKF